MLEQIENDLRAALKEGDKSTTSALRMLKSALINARIAKGAELNKADYLKVLQKEAKQHQESIESFASAGRDTQTQMERAELEVIERYLPASLTEDEIDKMVVDAITETGAAGPQDMGTVMKLLAPKFAGRADGGVVAGKVRARLR